MKHEYSDETAKSSPTPNNKLPWTRPSLRVIDPKELSPDLLQQLEELAVKKTH